MKKTINALVTNTAKRILAAALALTMLPGVLSYQDVFAASDDSSKQSSVSDGSSETEVSTEPEGITVWKDGKMQQLDAKTGAEWVESDVSGSDEPTLAAKTVAEWTSNQGAVSITSGENLYSLTAATGISPGTSVEYFAVRYKVGTGNNAVAQTKYIFPKIHTLSASNDYINTLKKTEQVSVLSGVTISGLYSPGPRMMVQTTSSYYKVSNDEEIEAAKKDFLKKASSISSVQKHYTKVEKQFSIAENRTIADRHAYLKAFNYKINENTLTENALSSWGVDEFLFKTDEPITEVTGVEVFMSNGKWTVQGLTVSKVNKVGGYQEYGYYSGKYFLSLEKEIICQLTKKKSGTLTLSANGDTLVNVGGDDSVYFALTKPEKKTVTSLGYDDLYTFRLDFADTVKGGLESYLRNDPKSSDPAVGSIAEDLAIEIEYKDINGYVRNVTMPVLLSVLGQYKESGDNVRTIGLAQRGDTLAFTGCLPDFSSILTTKLYVGKAARNVLQTNCGLDFKNENKIDSTLLSDLDGDNISVAGISMYKGTCRMSNTKDGTETVVEKDKNGKETKTTKTYKSYSVAFAFSEKAPMLYYTTTQKNGYKVSAKTSDKFVLTKYKTDDPLIATGLAGNFLIRLKTGDVAGADTSGVIKAQIFYQDTNGNDKSSSVYNVKTEVENFLGYWPSKFERYDNFAYSYGLSQGRYLEFPVDLPDAAAITNIQLSLDNFADEWQISSISAAVIDGVGKRRIYEQSLTAGTNSSAYRIVRPMARTVIPPFPIDLDLLFTPGDTYSVSTGAGTVITSDEVDYNSMRYSMTHEQTTYDLGFIKTKKIYDIDVKVADDPESSSENGDAGSTNQFYFQLRFKNGSSAFVLANQQLSADGFRAGQDEMFTIQTNRDYGELQAIRIIPEDTSEDNDVFDKLNIEYITVTEQSTGGTALQYVINNVGWIDIDYYDKSEDNTSQGRDGRLINVLARRFTVSYKQNVVNLLCEVTADPWEQNYFPFEASVSCTIDYIDTKGEPRSVSFDVIKRMYEYMKKTPAVLSGSYKPDENSSLFLNMGTVSDANWMLRPNHKDRFILPALADVKTLISMTFKGTNRSKGTAYWVISGLSISRIDSDSGVVSITKDDEYYRNMKTISHCDMQSDTEAKTLILPSGAAQKIKINLNQKDITWSADKSWISAVERNPTSSDNILNIYVFPTENSRNIEDINLNIAAQYTMPNSKVMQIKQNSLNTYGSGTKDAMFYCTGLSAPEMQNFTSLWLSCRSTKTVFTHAIVEQVRDDVIVSRYVINFGKSSATLGLRASPSATSTVFDRKKQVLTVSFGSLTNETNIIAPSEENSNVNDIAVALIYKSSLDPDGTTYSSPYVYLGDVGIKKLSPGMMVDIPFNVPYVKDIVGYKIGMFGDVKAEVRGAIAANYSYTDRTYDETTGQYTTTGDKLAKLYCFDQRFEVANGIEKYDVTSKKGMAKEGSVTPLELNITTAEAEADSESGINTPVEATIWYKDIKGAEKSFEIDDLRVYIQPEEESRPQQTEGSDTLTSDILSDMTDNDYKQFSTGSTRKIKLMIPECIEITDIELKPTKQNWKIERIDGTMYYAWKVEKDDEGNPVYTGQKITRVVKDTFTPEGKRISLRDVDLVTHLYADDKYLGIVTDHEKSIVCQGEKIIRAQVLIENGFDLKVELLGEKAAEMPDGSYVKSDGGFSFMLPKNNGSVQVTYMITVISKENPNVMDVINVTVPVPEQKQQNYQSDSGNNSGSSTDDSGSKDKTDSSKNDEGSSEDNTQSSTSQDDSSESDDSSKEDTKTDDSTEQDNNDSTDGTKSEDKGEESGS